MAPRFFVRLALMPLACAVLFAACAHPLPYDAPLRTGSMPAGIRESSGLAASRLDPRVLWTHNDSGGQPVLYALEPNGARRGDLRIAGLPNRDWEDLASFTLDGRSWLLIADTGDNAGNRTDCALYVVAEPEPAALSPAHEATATVAWKIPVRYLDGPRDCEAVAVDARAGRVYLLAKRTSPHGLYALPLRPPADGVMPAAMPVAQFHNSSIPQPTASQSLMPIPTGRYRAQPTGMDFAADGSAAVIVSYGDVLVFPRRENETWPAALLHPPVVLAPHGLAQAEGVCFGADSRTLYVSSEGEASGIIRYKSAR
ncbi:MAG TPA: hypothetical protein VIO38_08350 [Rariglobus sp.]